MLCEKRRRKIKVIEYSSNHTSGYFATDVSVLYFQKKNDLDVLFYIPESNFAGMVSAYFKDYPALAEKIKNKKLKYKHVEKILKEYNKHFE